MEDSKTCELNFEWKSDLSSLITLSFEGMVLCDGLKILEVNNSFCELVESEDFLVRGKKLDSFISPSSRELFLDVVGTKSSYEFEISIDTQQKPKIVKCRVQNLNKYSAFVFKDVTVEKTIKSEL
ncbi:MAG: hypothetical protein ACLFQJ_02105, partial [Campylobacterales bacterium]